MNSKRLVTTLCLLLITQALAAQVTWQDKKAEGWAWYEDKKQQEKKEAPSTLAPKEQLAQEKKALEEHLAKAIMSPTEENVRTYMIAQKKWIDQSKLFSNVWSKNLLLHPELDPTATLHPTSHYGIQIRKSIQRGKVESLIKELSKDHGLFFFYEGRSQISQAVSLVVRKFAQKHQWKVIAIAVDSIQVPGFSVNREDNGIAEKWGIRVFPALFVVEPIKQSITPIAYGLVTLDQVEENISLQFTNIPEEFHE